MINIQRTFIVTTFKDIWIVRGYNWCLYRLVRFFHCDNTKSLLIKKKGDPLLGERRKSINCFECKQLGNESRAKPGWRFHHFAKVYLHQRDTSIKSLSCKNEPLIQKNMFTWSIYMKKKIYINTFIELPNINKANNLFILVNPAILMWL